MATKMQNNSPQSDFSFFERAAFLLGRFIILFSLVYVALVFYTQTWRHYQVPKTSSFIFLMLILLVCWAAIAFGRRFIRSCLAAPAAFFFFVMMVTTLFSVNLTEAWETLTFYAACLFLAVMVPKFFFKLRDFEVFTYIMGVVSILVCIYALAQKFDWPLFFSALEPFGLGTRFTPKPVSFMGNENYAAEFLNMSLPICLMMIFCYIRRPAELIFFTFATMLNVVTMYYIDCNASYMGFAVAVPVMLLLGIKFRMLPWLMHIGVLKSPEQKVNLFFRNAVVVTIFLVAILSTLVASVNNPLRQELTEMASWVDVDGDHRPDGIPPIIFRLQCMDAAIRNIVETPVAGIGAGNFKVVHPLYESQLERKVLGEETLARKVHNDHLWHAVEFGIFGLFGWYWLIAVAVYAIIRSMLFLYQQDKRRFYGQESDDKVHHRKMTPYANTVYFYLQLGILGGIIVAVISCAFGHTFVLPASSVTFWLIAGVGVAIFQKMRRYETGLPMPVFGTTNESLTKIQFYTSRVPVWLRLFLMFLLVLPLGYANTKQLVGETWLKMGMNSREVNNFNAVFYCFDRAQDIYPYQMEVYYILGRYYIDAIVQIDNVLNNPGPGQDNAIKQLQQMNLFSYYLPRKPNESQEAYQTRIMSETKEQRLERLNQKKYDLITNGIVVLQNDLFMNPNYKWAHNNLGVLYDRLNNFNLSSAAYNRVLNIDKEQIYAHYNLGLGYMMQQDYEKAIRHLEQALVVDPGKTEIYDFLARNFLNIGDYKRTYRAINRYLGLLISQSLFDGIEKNDLQIPTEELQAILNQIDSGNIDQALAQARDYINFSQSNAQGIYQIYLKLAHRFVTEGEFTEEKKRAAEQSISIAENLFSVPPNEAFLVYGKIYKTLDKPQKAIEHYMNYLRTNPDDIEARPEIANYLGMYGQFAQAAEVFKPVVEEHPQDWGYLISYARILAGSGQYEWSEIFPYIKQAIEIGGDKARALLVENTKANLLLPYIKKDIRFRELLGAEYVNKLQGEEE